MSTMTKKRELPPMSFAESHNFSRVVTPVFSTMQPRAFSAPTVTSYTYGTKAWQGAESHSGTCPGNMPANATPSKDMAGALRPRNVGGRYWSGTESHNAANFVRPVDSFLRR